MDLIFEQYENRLRRKHRHERTIRLFRYAAERYESELLTFGQSPSTVEPWQVEEVFADMELAWNTRRSILASVRSAYTYALRRGLVSSDPTYDVDLGDRPESAPVTIPGSELRAISSGLRYESDALLFALLAYTGMRQFEIGKLMWDDVNLQRGMIKVLGKRQKLRWVPIHPALGEVLPPFHLGQPVIRWVHYRHLQRFAPGRSFHDFRRTAATSLRRNGADREVIDAIFGWKPRSIREMYYDQVDDEEMQRNILRIYLDNPL